MSTKAKIKSKCKKLQDLLLEKNDKYGDASLKPINIFSKVNAVTSIKARIDDKLKRISNAGILDDTEDTLQDLAGYLILLMIAKENESHDIQKRIRQNESPSHQSETSLTADSKWKIKYDSI